MCFRLSLVCFSRLKMSGLRSRNWCFTLNNPVSDDIPEMFEQKGALYGVWQKEEGEQGTPHLQGYVMFSETKTMSAVLKMVAPWKPHLEKRRGTHAQAKAYCEKTKGRLAGPWSFGEEPAGQGKRNDLAALKRALDEGLSEVRIADSDDLFPVWVKHFKAIERYKRLKSEKSRNWATITQVLYGPPGTGKTRWVHEHAGPDAYWLKKPGQGQTAFFDGYEGQEDVVIDEFYGWLPFDLLCRMCDRYPLMVDTKGGMTNFYPRRIWITSNKHPNEWYPRMGLGAMERRLSEPLGRIVECPHGWNGTIKVCDPKPSYFASVEASSAYAFHHARCTEDRCFVVEPVVEEPAPVRSPSVEAGIAALEAMGDEIMEDIEKERERVAVRQLFHGVEMFSDDESGECVYTGKLDCDCMSCCNL